MFGLQNQNFGLMSEAELVLDQIAFLLSNYQRQNYYFTIITFGLINQSFSTEITPG